MGDFLLKIAYRLEALGTSGTLFNQRWSQLQIITSPYSRKVALGIFGQCNAEAV